MKKVFNKKYIKSNKIRIIKESNEKIDLNQVIKFTPSNDKLTGIINNLNK